MDIFALLHVDNMEIIKEEELKTTIGGAISASMISAVVRGINSLLDLGRSVGTAIRRLRSGKICSL